MTTTTEARSFPASGTGLIGHLFPGSSSSKHSTPLPTVATKRGGDEAGNDLRETTYAPNIVKQYFSVNSAGHDDILGIGLAYNAVTINGDTGLHKGEYYRNELSITNANGAVWQSISINSSTTNIPGGLICPGANQTMTYDADGNLTFDGVWVYRWDAENRLKEMYITNVVGLAYSNRFKLEFSYDYQGRRIKKTVSKWNGSSYTGAVTKKYIYDGWNMVAVLSVENSLEQSFLWGKDLSGTLDQAGGVGGLLVYRQHTLPSGMHFACYDGNGNVIGLVDSATKTVSARYEYGPFGEVIRVTGPVAVNNPIRWSSKFTDNESGLVNYGRRYYSPTLGRWIAKDPIGEEGGINLYSFVRNCVLQNVDTLGEFPWRIDPHPGGIDIHDTIGGVDITYGLDANGEAFGFSGYDRGGIHTGQAPGDLVERSVKESLCDEKRLNNLIGKANIAEQTTKSGSGLSKLGRIKTSALSTLKSMGKAGGGAVIGAVAIFSAVSSSNASADIAFSYGKNMKAGNVEYADLDAIALAVNIQEANGNYFVTMYALDLLLSD